MTALDKAEVSRRRARAGRIREGIQSYIHTLGDVAAAYAERDWEALGYESWDQYVDGEFGASRLRLSPEHRQKAVNELRLAGLSQRAIGSAVGVSQETVRRDLAGDTNVSPDEAPAQVKGVDGKTYQTPARRDLAPSSIPEPEVIPAGEPDQLEEVAPAAGGREDGAASSFEPSAGPDATAVHLPGRPGLESDDDRARREHHEALQRDRDRLRKVIDGWPTMRNSILPNAPEADEILDGLGEGDRLAIKQIINEVTGA